MTSVLARLGSSLESRLAPQTLWSSGKRKRGDWICVECRRRGGVRQIRAYVDDAAGTGGIHNPFVSRGRGDNEVGRKLHARAGEEARAARPWGLGVGDRRPGREVEVEETEVSEEQQQTKLFEEFERVMGEPMDTAPSCEASADKAPADEAPSDQATSNETQGDSTHQMKRRTQQARLFDIDYKSRLQTALEQNAPDTVARCLLAAESRNDRDFIQSIPDVVFTECIQILQPLHFTVKLGDVHMEISECMQKQFGIASMHYIAWDHINLLKKLWQIRHDAGVKMGLADYRMLLRASRDLASRAFADWVWKAMMAEEVKPDTECYNYHMEAYIWNGSHHAGARRQTRVIPFYQIAREWRYLGRKFMGYRVGRNGMKEQVLETFGQMLKNGAVANEDSFCNIILGCAREGDMSTVKTILRRTWGIDVDGLQDGKTIEPKKIAKDSPVYPSEHLLFTIAHAFGANNDVPTALRLTDIVARKYDITIDHETWEQLFEWTFVLGSERSGVKSRTDGTKTGQLPIQSLLSLWNTMIGPPYFVKPTMGMYNRLIRNLAQRDHGTEIVAKMYEGLELAVNQRQQAYEAKKAIKEEIGPGNRGYEAAEHNLEQDDESKDNDLDAAISALADARSRNRRAPTQQQLHHESLYRQAEYHNLIRRRNNWWLRRWLRQLLTISRIKHATNDYRGHWSLRNFPRILWDWRAFAGLEISYEVPGGFVELNMRTPEQLKNNQAKAKKQRMEDEVVLGKVRMLLGAEWTRPRTKQARGAEEEKVGDAGVGWDVEGEDPVLRR